MAMDPTLLRKHRKRFFQPKTLRIYDVEHNAVLGKHPQAQHGLRERAP